MTTNLSDVQIADLNLSTDDVTEGTALYFTDTKARTAAVLNTLGGSETNQAPSVSAVNDALALKADDADVVKTVNSLSPTGGAITLDSDDVAEGTVNQYFTEARARLALSVAAPAAPNGNGDLSYNNLTGEFTYTPPAPATFTEVNDLTAAVTWANVPDANITETSVTQHEGALTLTSSQITDLNTVLSGYAPVSHTHTASDITNFDTEVSANTDVAANTAKVSADGSIDTHSDVNTATKADGQVLTWNNTAGEWQPTTVAVGGSDLAVEDEGISLVTAATKLNFTGAGVTATNPTGTEVTVNIPGGGGGGGTPTLYNAVDAYARLTNAGEQNCSGLGVATTGGGESFIYWSAAQQTLFYCQGGTGRVYTTTSTQGVYEWTDRGIVGVGAVRTVVEPGDGRVYFGTSNTTTGFFYTADGGNNWGTVGANKDTGVHYDMISLAYAPDFIAPGQGRYISGARTSSNQKWAYYDEPSPGAGLPATTSQWINISGAPPSSAGKGIVWTGTRFVACGGNTTTGGSLSWSSDGLTWTTTSSGATTPYGALSYANGKLLAISQTDNSLKNAAVSTDEGLNWTIASIDAGSSGYTKPTYVPEFDIYITCMTNNWQNTNQPGRGHSWSKDGLKWHRTAPKLTNSVWDSLCTNVTYFSPHQTWIGANWPSYADTSGLFFSVISS